MNGAVQKKRKTTRFVIAKPVRTLVVAIRSLFPPFFRKTLMIGSKKGRIPTPVTSVTGSE